ncbi:hypothetical protein [Kitasatospora sp. NPDC093102]|uniref:hypothetical protein n=1 Tax=Kitasatospora sp. NPDC093102 TaxID=3155069 RepID=UPI00343FD0EC
MTGPVFAPGSTAVGRDVACGRVRSAMPYTVLADDGVTLTLTARPGTETLAPAGWTLRPEGPLPTLPATALSTPAEGD